MKTKIYLFAMGLAFSLLCNAQVPNSFKYQAVARNSSGEVLANQSVSFKISILQGSSSGGVVFSERHSVSTNVYGLVSLDIGKGSNISGSMIGLDWGGNRHFLKVELDPSGGSSYQFMGTTELLSVPYALHAKTVENDMVEDADPDPLNEIQSLTIDGNQLNLSHEGGTVDLPETGDNWGSQVVVNRIRLIGHGTSDYPLDIAGQGADYGQVLKWNGSNWFPMDDNGMSLPFEEIVSHYTYALSVTNDSGPGITGVSSAASGNNAGVFGASHSNEGRGIWGFVSAATGTTIGVGGGVNSSEGYSGYFVGGRFYVEGNLGIGNDNPSYKLYVSGEAAKTDGTTAWIISSDKRLKNLLGSYDSGLSEILELQPVRFKYKADNHRLLPSEKEQVGFIAQDVQKVFPEAVSEGEDGYLDFNIHSINVALVNAVKELNSKIDQLSAENGDLKQRLERLESIMTAGK